jgi:hypothetical protein
MKTILTPPAQVIADCVAKLRAVGINDETVARVYAAIADFELSAGSSEAELDALRAKFSQDSVQVICWLAIHPRKQI